VFQTALETAQNAIGRFLQTEFAGLTPGCVADGMRYAVDGGKRLRGFLALESARVYNVPQGQALFAAGAVECIHAYSLVHDDLPCMDDDDLRRGRPTVHLKWDEATAILVGDALQSFAFELLSRDGAGDAKQRITLISALAKASGAEGMVLGQARDIVATTTRAPLGLEEVTALQSGKTGALITWSAQAGAILGRADAAPLQRYAQAVGLAFQIADDILDVEGNAATAGKRLQKDAGAKKATFVSLLGLKGAKARAADLVAQAEAALTPLGDAAETLRTLACYMVDRDR